MPRCPGSKYLKKDLSPYDSRPPNREHLKGKLISSKIHELKEIFKKYGKNYDDIINKNKEKERFVEPLYMNGMGSIFFIKEGDIGTLTYRNGKSKDYLISSS
jgi:hypothetical protein